MIEFSYEGTKYKFNTDTLILYSSAKVYYPINSTSSSDLYTYKYLVLYYNNFVFVNDLSYHFGLKGFEFKALPLEEIELLKDIRDIHSILDGWDTLEFN